jgi:pilus assembly protein CpaB
MSRGIIIMAFVAIAFGVAAMFGLRSWLAAQNNIAASRAPVSKMVIAANPIAFGEKLDRKNLKVIDWPGETRPAGSFTTIDRLLKDGEKPVDRYAKFPLVENEPVLESRITGPNQKATLSTMLKPGHKAVAIRVNDINGVAGFVLPGDRVDIFLTREEGSRSAGKTSFVDVLLQEIKVLAVDQRASQETDKPVVARAVTVDVTTEQAQILALAADVGRLSLALRNASGADDPVPPRRISLDDLSGAGSTGKEPAPAVPAPPPPLPAPAPVPVQAVPSTPVVDPGPKRVSVGVIRNNVRTSYDVLALQ